MRKDKIIALIASLIVAVGFGVFIEYFSNYINSNKSNEVINTENTEKKIPPQNPDNNREMIDTNLVLVASENIAHGDTLFSKSIKWVEWPKKNISKEFISKDSKGYYMHPSLTLESILGLMANTHIVSGAPITVGMFVKRENITNKKLNLRKGMRAISVPVDKNSIKHHAFTPGDIVEVYLPNKKKCISNVRILAFDNKTEMLKFEKALSKQEHSNHIMPDTVTLELTSEQSDIMVQNLKGGGVYLVLMNAEDTDENAVPFEKPLINSDNLESKINDHKSEIENIKTSINNNDIKNEEKKDSDDNSMILIIKKDKAGFVNPHNIKHKIGD